MTKTRKLKNNELNPNTNLAIEEGIIAWTQFYRANPHRFIVEYLGLPLHLFQMFIIYMFDIFNHNMLCCARGTGKSYVTAVYSCCRCILYPGTAVLIGASTKGQAKLLISQKIEKDIYLKSPNLRREIKEIKCNGNEAKVIFHNGSSIEAVVSGEQSRGFRCNILIIDEFRLVSKEIIDRIMTPFLNVNRRPPFMNKNEYSDYPVEENKQVFLSSCYFKSSEAYVKFKGYVDEMLKGNDYFVLNTNYELLLYHRMTTEAFIEAQRKEMDSVSWAMEMDSLWWGESESAFFKSEIVNPRRTIAKPFYPPTNIDYLMAKRKGKTIKCNINRLKGEKRVLSADIALSKHKSADNSVYTLMRILPDRDSFKKEVVYLESHQGMKPELQAIRIKQLFYDFDVDCMIIDTNGVGNTVWNELQKIQYDSERDEEYSAFTCFNEDNKVDKMMSRNSLPVVYSLTPNPKFNSEMALDVRGEFDSGKLSLLLDDIKAKEIVLEKEKDFMLKPSEEQARLLAPFVQTSALINELINLEYKIGDQTKLITVTEVGTARKDRYSSLGYANFLADYLIKKELKRRKGNRKQIFSLW